MDEDEDGDGDGDGDGDQGQDQDQGNRLGRVDKRAVGERGTTLGLGLGLGSGLGLGEDRREVEHRSQARQGGFDGSGE